MHGALMLGRQPNSKASLATFTTQMLFGRFKTAHRFVSTMFNATLIKSFFVFFLSLNNVFYNS